MIPAAERARAAETELAFEAVGTAQVVDGAPTTGFAVLGELGGAEYGVWEMTAGAMSDTEADEVFVVVEGSADIEFPDSGERMQVTAGDLVRLHAGQRTIWRVADRIRKVYLAV